MFDLSESEQNIGGWCNFNLKYPNFKNFCIESTKKPVKNKWMYLTQQFWNFEISVGDVRSNYELFLPVLNTFAFDTEEYS